MARYGQKFKDAVVVRLLPPEISSLEAVSQKVGISVATPPARIVPALAEGVHATPAKPVLHGHNGATLKATTVLAWLGIRPSYSRPRVSDDNPFVEALFRTAKYRPAFPTKGFAGLDAARQWAAGFVHWYNHEHHHSGIRYVTPAERHAGQDRALLDHRHALYQPARERNPRRWSRQTRNWTPIAAVALNPERDAVVRAALVQSQSITRNRAVA